MNISEIPDCPSAADAIRAIPEGSPIPATLEPAVPAFPVVPEVPITPTPVLTMENESAAITRLLDYVACNANQVDVDEEFAEHIRDEYQSRWDRLPDPFRDLDAAEVLEQCAPGEYRHMKQEFEAGMKLFNIEDTAFNEEQVEIARSDYLDELDAKRKNLEKQLRALEKQLEFHDVEVTIVRDYVFEYEGEDTNED